MATIDLKTGGTAGHPGRKSAKPYPIAFEVDLADALAAKGSALAAADVVEVFSIPADSYVLAGGAVVVTAGDSTTLTVHFGDATDPDRYAVSADGKVVAYAATASTAAHAVSATETAQFTFATLTGTLTSGVLKGWVVLVDIGAQGNPGSTS